MVNFNGSFHSETATLFNLSNRGYRYGDALFETIKTVNAKIFFWEEHYLRLMASMRILRMEIPMNFTLEFLEEEILKTVKENNLLGSPARVRLSVFRNEGGYYMPNTNHISYAIEVVKLDSPFYTISESAYEVELYKDHYINSDLLSTLKTNNRIINVTGSIYADENGYDNCMLLNSDKNVVEALNANIFMVNGNIIKTPPLTDGCLNGILRKQIIKIINSTDAFELQEMSISPFELQKADELFLTNVIKGIIPITKYRKKEYKKEVSRELLGKLNAAVRLL